VPAAVFRFPSRHAASSPGAIEWGRSATRRWSERLAQRRKLRAVPAKTPRHGDRPVSSIPRTAPLQPHGTPAAIPSCIAMAQTSPGVTLCFARNILLRNAAVAEVARDGERRQRSSAATRQGRTQRNCVRAADQRQSPRSASRAGDAAGVSRSPWQPCAARVI
jgi:hypothetical protein